MNFLIFIVLFCISLPSRFCSPAEPGALGKADKCGNDLDGLVVKWGLPGSNNPLAFNRLPRTIKDAEAQNWKLIDDGCEDPSLQHKGKRYILGDDVSVLIVYDGQGHVAGVQTSIPKDEADRSEVMDYATMSFVYYENILGKDRYVFTTYFVKPSSICHGRTDYEFETQGTLQKLYIQNGEDSYMTPPMIYDEAALEAKKWAKGLCVRSMGLHHFLNNYENTPCPDIKPYFVLYNCNRLVGVGRIMIGNFTQDPRYETVPKQMIRMFLDPIPSCLYDMYQPPMNGITALHMFFTDSPQKVIDCSSH